MPPDQQDQRGLFGATNTAEATHQLHEGTRAMATRYDTSIPLDPKELHKQEIARELLPLLEAFEQEHEGEPSFAPGQVNYTALRRLIFNVQYDAQGVGV